MRYIGGKHRQGKKIGSFITPHVSDRTYVEPFAGAMGVARHVLPHTTHAILSDISKPIMDMWEHLVQISIPELEQLLPDDITEDVYADVRNNPKDFPPWMEAYVASGMSFGGKWWGGYARDSRGGESLSAGRLKRSVIAKVKDIQKGRIISWESGSYDSLDIPHNSVIYCDPPYIGKTVGYKDKGFDHPAFWQWCRNKVADGHILIATEFNAPDDFIVLHSFGDTTVRHLNACTPYGSNNEVIICHGSQAYIFDS